MSDLTFLIYFSTDRLHNLQQMLAFLAEREQGIDARLLLLCQNGSPHVPAVFPTTLINLRETRYKRARAINIGMKNIQTEKVAIMDSDRVLPPNYFTRHSNFERGTVLSTRHLFNLARAATDDEVRYQHNLVGEWWKRMDDPTFPQRNIMSGNTLMYREDFFNCGGMDETYTGYGFQDNDFAMQALKCGLTFTFVDEVEIHLHHERATFSWDDFLRNGEYFERKWGAPPNMEVFRRQLSRRS